MMPNLIAILMLACPPWCADIGNRPCDCADMDGNGVVDLEKDLWAVLNLVALRHKAGDINCDGNVDPDDLADWITAYWNCVS